MRVLLAAFTALLAVASSASAATVTASLETESNRGGSFTYTKVSVVDDTEEANVIAATVEEGGRPSRAASILTATAGALTAGEGCLQLSPTVVRCASAISREASKGAFGPAMVVSLAGGDDRFSLDYTTTGGMRSTVDGGDGDDVVSAPDAFASGGPGADVLTAQEADGGDGDDVLTGGELDGGAGDDRLQGVDLIDVLTGGTGDDTLTGGPRGDYLQPGPGQDTVDGGGGIDRIDYREDPGPVVVDLRGTAPSGDADRISGVENAIGSSSAKGDRITGDDGPNVLSGAGAAGT